MFPRSSLDERWPAHDEHVKRFSHFALAAIALGIVSWSGTGCASKPRPARPVVGPSPSEAQFASQADAPAAASRIPLSIYCEPMPDCEGCLVGQTGTRFPHGSLRKDVIHTVIQGHHSDLRSCYDRVLGSPASAVVQGD